jgi:hypothetical protein
MALFYNLEIGYMFQFVKITKRKPLPYRVELQLNALRERKRSNLEVSNPSKATKIFLGKECSVGLLKQEEK